MKISDIELFQDVSQPVRRIFRPPQDLAGLRLFLVAMAGGQGFAHAFELSPTHLWCVQRSSVVRNAQCNIVSPKGSFFLWSRNRLQIDANVTRKPVAEIKARLHGASCLFLLDELPCSNLRGPVNWLSEYGCGVVAVRARACSHPGDFSLK